MAIGNILLWEVLPDAFPFRIKQSNPRSGRASSQQFGLAVCFSNRAVRGQALRLSTITASMLLALAGISTTALPLGFRGRWNNLKTASPSTYGRSATSKLTDSSHPSSREGLPFHRWSRVFSSYLILDGHHATANSGPAELGVINPYAVYDDGQPTRQRHDQLPGGAWRFSSPSGS